MHHLYPSLKGDPLCPLGFHPQTRYPTRCKRCFRDYKEHGGRRGLEEIASSSPNISDNLNANQSARTWTSTQNLSVVQNGNRTNNDIVVHFNVELKKRPQSWGSTPDIDDKVQRSASSSAIKPVENNVDVTVSLPIPPRRHTLDLQDVQNSLSKSSSSTASTSSNGKSSSRSSIPDELVILSTDSLAERVRKMNLIKQQRSSSRERSVPRKSDDESESKPKPPPERPERTKPSTITAEDRKSLPPKKTSTTSFTETSTPKTVVTPPSPKPAPKSVDVPSLNDVSILLKTSKTNKVTVSNTKPTVSNTFVTNSPNDNTLTKTTTTTTVTLHKIPEKPSESLKPKPLLDKTPVKSVKEEDLSKEVKTLREELSLMKQRAERAERDKSDILLRRLASMDTSNNRTAASEALSLQQKVNELHAELEKVNDEKRRLNMRMREIENNPKGSESELRRKLQAAETLCEELMEENQEAKKEIMNLQNEMDEIQDTYRDDEMKQKTNLQKDLEKSVKNCRILSFKLKKCERRIETLEQEQQGNSNDSLLAKIKKLEDELRFSNDLACKLQAEAEELRNPGKKKNPTLKVIGRSTSADGKFTREMLTRGGSQEDPQQLLRDLQDSVERESDLKDQLKFAEEEADNLRKKVARFEDENDSLMLQIKKMAARSRGRKLSPNSNHLTVGSNEHDEGISDEEDPHELRILLELNEQEASKLRLKVESLEKENYDVKKQVKDLQEKLWTDSEKSGKSGLLSAKTSATNTANANTTDRQIKALHEEIDKLRKQCSEKDILFERLQAENAAKTLRNNNAEISKLNEALSKSEKEKGELQLKLKRIVRESEEKLPKRSPKRVTDLTPKNTLKKWVEELEEEINDMRVLVANSSADQIKSLQSEKTSLLDELIKCKDKLSQVETDLQKYKGMSGSTQKASDLEQKLKKSEDDSKKLVVKIRTLEDKIKTQDSQIKQIEAVKNSLESQNKNNEEKLSNLESDYDKERKERKKLESKLKSLDDELAISKKAAEKTKSNLEKEIKELKAKTSKSDSKQVQELKKQLEDLQVQLNEEKKSYAELNAHWEKLSEETVFMRAQLTTEKQNLESDLSNMKSKLDEMESIRIDRTVMAKKLSEAQSKVRDLELKIAQNKTGDYEKTVLKNKLHEKELEYDRLRRENEMNIDLVFQLRKDNDDLNSKLNDFQRIEQAQSSINGYSTKLEADIKELKTKLESAEVQSKSEVAATRLRYEQQLKNLHAELNAMQRQCEKFKKDRDAFKSMLESAQKKISDLKKNNSGRQSRSSMASSDDDDKNKIAYFEKQVGTLEDQLVEARLEASKIKTELVSERSANEIKISEMQSKLNELEEERVISTGRTKIPGLKSKLELSWQKEREDQQRLLQETSTLARDLRQTLFEVERERDKERLESKRRMEQLKRTTEEEMEEGRKKIAELQCDLLELRDVHAKLRTSNEKLRRERERYEKELVRRRMEQDGSERQISTLLESVDELIKISPDIKMNKSEANNKRSLSPSPGAATQTVSQILARLTEASNEMRKLQQRNVDDEMELRIRRSIMRRAASQESDGRGSTSSVVMSTSSSRNGGKLSRFSQYNNSLMRKSLSLDQAMQQQQNIWRQDDGSASSIQSIDSNMSGLDSRLSGGSTQSDIPMGPRKKKKSLMGKLRSLAKSSRNSESEISVQGSESDVSVASDMRASKKDLRGRLSGMFKRSGSTSRHSSMERVPPEHRPVAVTVVGDEDGPQPKEPPPTTATALRPVRTVKKPPTPNSSAIPTLTSTRRSLAK